MVRGLAKRLLAFQDHHHRAVGFVFFEIRTDTHHRFHRRRIHGCQWYRVLLGDHFQLGDKDVHDDSERHPEQDDRQRENSQRVRDERSLAVRVGVFRHPDFTKQKVWALPPTARRSSRSSLSILIRQPIWPLLPCTIMVASTAGRTVTTVYDQGSGTSLSWWTFASASQSLISAVVP